jgi:Flp pilus assembly protein TadG
MSSPKSRRSRSDRASGQSLAEFALVFPVLILLLIAIFDAGRLVFAYNDITNAARSGVRVAIVNQGGTSAAAATIAQATSLNLQPSDVTVSYLTNDLSGACTLPYKVGCLARIRVDYQWRAITPVIGSILGPITVSTETTMPIERVFP